MKRLELLRKNMLDNDYDALIINNKANRFYLSGFTGTYAQIVIDRTEQFIIADGRYFEQLKKQAPRFEVIDNHMKMDQALKQLIQNKGYQRIGIEADEMKVSEYLALSNLEINLVPTRNLIETQRTIKDDVELKKIQKAAAIADSTYEHVLSYIKTGMSEKQVANEIDRYGLEHGADAPAFETIVASGKRSALPHGHASNKLIDNHELIIIDFGFMVDHYYSDITRTIAMGSVSKVLKHIFDVTLIAQQAAIKACQIGKPLNEIDASARNLITSEGFGENFLHGLGHGLGLTVHEYPLLNQQAAAKLKAQMTFTVEPGIYLENKGGARIEDDIYLNEAGNPIILTHAPRQWLQI